MFALVYSSRAAVPMATADLLNLLEEARAHNQAHELTGILLHQDGAFLQLLEGSEAEVTAIYSKIRTDPRHTDVHTVWVSSGVARHFSTWSMAFTDLSEVPIAHPAFSDLLSVRKRLDEDPAQAEDLLQVLESSLRS